MNILCIGKQLWCLLVHTRIITWRNKERLLPSSGSATDGEKIEYSYKNNLRKNLTVIWDDVTMGILGRCK